MKPNCTEITNLDERKRIESKIIHEWDNGVLSDYKKKYTNAKVDLSLPNKDVDYCCNIFNGNGDLVGRFSIIGNRIIVSKLKIIETT